MRKTLSDEQVCPKRIFSNNFMADKVFRPKLSKGLESVMFVAMSQIVYQKVGYKDLLKYPN